MVVPAQPEQSAEKLLQPQRPTTARHRVPWPVPEQPVQSVHEPPVTPQASSAVPLAHLPPALGQQPPWHWVWVPSPQVVPQRDVAVSQASPLTQSTGLLQPQWPPLLSGMHTVFSPAVAQSVHALPSSPQTLLKRLSLPGWHVVPLQHPWLQGWPALHAVEHDPPLQALPLLQSDSLLQPHMPPLTHAEPFMPAQLVHVVPGAPQAPGLMPLWQLVPSQQAPLQTRPPAQPVVHLFVPVSHA